MLKQTKIMSAGLLTSLLGSLTVSPLSVLAQENIDNLVTDLCQTSIRVKLAANREIAQNNRNNITFETVERSQLSRGQTFIQGQARVNNGNNQRYLTYDCVVNVNEGLINRSNYTLRDNIALSSTRLCQEELKETIAQDFDGLVTFRDGLETYYISNTEEGVRGTALVKRSQRGEQTYRFNCTVNIQRGDVTRISYTPTNETDNETISDRRIINLCHNKLRQQISSNQIDIGGIIGINLGTGTSIDFQEEPEIFTLADNEQRVEGLGILTEGFQQRRVNYECIVNVERGTVSNATIE